MAARCAAGDFRAFTGTRTRERQLYSRAIAFAPLLGAQQLAPLYAGRCQELARDRHAHEGEVTLHHRLRCYCWEGYGGPEQGLSSCRISSYSSSRRARQCLQTQVQATTQLSSRCAANMHASKCCSG